MRRAINYIRSLFCKHEFEYEETLMSRVYDEYISFGTCVEKSLGRHERVSRTCKKCGYHKSYWKYD